MRPLQPSMSRHGRAGFASKAMLLLAGMVGAGCQSSGGTTPPADTPPAPPPSGRRAVVSSTDPCAMRLHDLCGPLLLHYAIHRDLPARLEQLSALPGFQNVRDFTCPVSGLAYVYDPASTISAMADTRVILYDPQPSHAGMRYAVSFAEPEAGGVPVTKVIPLPEAYFSRRPPTGQGADPAP